VAKKLGATEEQIQQIQNIYEEEKQLREKRASLFYPQGFNDVITEYHKLY
jgi:Spy/CpxP family protein refolding chaperone